jgi:hypothetical protein
VPVHPSIRVDCSYVGYVEAKGVNLKRSNCKRKAGGKIWKSRTFSIKPHLRPNDVGGLEDVCWPLVSKFARSYPAQVVRIFQGEKFHNMPSFGGEVKPAVPCRRFAACKRTLNVTWKSAFRQNSRLHFLAHYIPPLSAWISLVA